MHPSTETRPERTDLPSNVEIRDGFRWAPLAIEREFTPFPKIARLNRDIIITEKIDGTNAAIGVTEDGDVYAQSRSRVITPQADNFGFARWVYDHASELASMLGPGIHFGEWWGKGIQRGYGLESKRFSLFNTAKWDGLRDEFEQGTDGDLSVVPVLYEGLFDQDEINSWISGLWQFGSFAAPGFKQPEGIVIFHTAARTMFKVTLEKDEKPKGSTE